MGRFFDKKPQAGMPISLQGLAKGLAGMAYALEHMRVENGRVEWSAFGAPTLMFSDDGAGSSPALDSFGTISNPTHVLGKDASGNVGWVKTCDHADEHPESA
jgi:hypothetical protein